MSVESLPGEEWKPVPIENYSENYMVSSLGRVKSVDRWVFRKNGCPPRLYAHHLKERLMGNSIIRCYNSCTLTYNTKKKTCRIGQLVAEAFLPKPDDEHKWYVNHKDGDTFNDEISNLEWKLSVRECSRALHKIDPEKHVDMDALWRDDISRRMWVRVKCKESGDIFESIREAARYYNVPDWWLYKALSKTSGYCRCLNLTFERVKEEV